MQKWTSKSNADCSIFWCLKKFTTKERACNLQALSFVVIEYVGYKVITVLNDPFSSAGSPFTSVDHNLNEPFIRFVSGS